MLRRIFVSVLAGLLCGFALAALIVSQGPVPGATAGPLSRYGAGAILRVTRNLVSASLPLAAGPPTAMPAASHVPDTTAFILTRRNALMPQDIAAGSSSDHRLLSSGLSAPENLSRSPAPSLRPTLVVGPDDGTHVLWEEGDQVYYARSYGGSWSSPLAFATGQQPSAVLGRDGTLHVAFSNEFFGEVNVYYTYLRNGIWSLPYLVSRTSGLSAYPSIAADNSGALHVAWADRSPGHYVIYHGWLTSTWLYEPVPNARGIAPVLVSQPGSNTLHLAWQAPNVNDDLHEVYHSQGTTYGWSLPENISASPTSESVAVAMACDTAGIAHILWQEQSGGTSQVRYVGGRAGNWSNPERVSGQGVDAVEPAAAVSQGDQLNAVWREGNTLVYRRRAGSTGAWRPSKPLIANDGGLEDAAVATEQDGRFHMVWSAWVGATERDVFHSVGQPALPHQVFLPGTPMTP